MDHLFCGLRVLGHGVVNNGAWINVITIVTLTDDGARYDVHHHHHTWLMTVLGSAWREVTLCSCVRSIWSCGEPGPSHVTPLSNCRQFLQSKDPDGSITHHHGNSNHAADAMWASSDLPPGLKPCVFILLILSAGCFDESTARPEHRS